MQAPPDGEKREASVDAIATIATTLRECKPQVAEDWRESSYGQPALCNGEGGKLYEAESIHKIFHMYGTDHYVLPGGCLRNSGSLRKLVLTDDPLNEAEMDATIEEIEECLRSPFAHGDAIGIDVVILPSKALNEKDVPAVRRLLKLVEIKSSDKINAQTVASSLAFDRWMAQMNVKREWMLWSASDSISPLLTYPPYYLSGADNPAVRHERFCKTQPLFVVRWSIPPSAHVSAMQTALRNAAPPTRDLVDAVREIVQTHANSIACTTPEAILAIERMRRLFLNHENAVSIASAAQTASRKRRAEIHEEVAFASLKSSTRLPKANECDAAEAPKRRCSSRTASSN
jgi:hypothetical protein